MKELYPTPKIIATNTLTNIFTFFNVSKKIFFRITIAFYMQLHRLSKKILYCFYSNMVQNIVASVMMYIYCYTFVTFILL